MAFSLKNKVNKKVELVESRFDFKGLYIKYLWLCMIHVVSVECLIF